MAIKRHIYALCVPKTTFFGVFLNHQVLSVQVHYIGAHPYGVKQCSRCYSPSANIISALHRRVSCPWFPCYHSSWYTCWTWLAPRLGWCHLFPPRNRSVTSRQSTTSMSQWQDRSGWFDLSHYEMSFLVKRINPLPTGCPLDVLNPCHYFLPHGIDSHFSIFRVLEK